MKPTARSKRCWKISGDYGNNVAEVKRLSVFKISIALIVKARISSTPSKAGCAICFHRTILKLHRSIQRSIGLIAPTDGRGICNGTRVSMACAVSAGLESMLLHKGSPNFVATLDEQVMSLPPCRSRFRTSVWIVYSLDSSRTTLWRDKTAVCATHSSQLPKNLRYPPCSTACL